MMRKLLITTIMVGLISWTAIPGYTQQKKQQGNLKVGYVDLQAVLKEFKPYKDAMKKLKEYQKNLKKEMDRNRSQISKLRSELKEGGEFLNKKTLRKKQQKLQRRMQSYQKQRRTSQQMMQRKEQELLNPVRDQVKEAVKITAEELDYDVIHRFGEERPSTIIWVSNRVDATQDVIKRLSEIETTSSQTGSEK